MLSPAAVIMPGMCQVLVLLSCLCRCQRCTRSVPTDGTCTVMPAIPGVPVHLLCAGLQMCAGSRAALGWEHGLEHGARLGAGVPVAVVPPGSAEA